MNNLPKSSETQNHKASHTGSKTEKSSKKTVKPEKHQHHHQTEKPKYPQRDETDPFSKESWVY